MPLIIRSFTEKKRHWYINLGPNPQETNRLGGSSRKAKLQKLLKSRSCLLYLIKSGFQSINWHLLRETCSFYEIFNNVTKKSFFFIPLMQFLVSLITENCIPLINFLYIVNWFHVRWVSSFKLKYNLFQKVRDINLKKFFFFIYFVRVWRKT